jgi:hypothetical protein
MQATTPIGALQQAQQKSDHSSNRKKNKRSRKLKKALSKLEPRDFSPLSEGELVVFVLDDKDDFFPDRKFTEFWGLVISSNKSKKKWLRYYNVLTERDLWQVYHTDIENNYRIGRSNNEN